MVPIALPTIDQLIVETLKRDGFYFVFNTKYNDIQAFGKPVEKEEATSLMSSLGFDKSATDEDSRKELLAFLNDNFPDVKTYDVYDFAPPEFIEYPFLGSIAVDVTEQHPAYSALVKKYCNPWSGETSCQNNAVFWVMPYEEAEKIYSKRNEILDDF
jgi:hypothetical protein